MIVLLLHEEHKWSSDHLLVPPRRPPAANPPSKKQPPVPSVCSAEQVREADSRESQMQTSREEFSKSGKRLRVDEDGFELWSTLTGEYWIPGGEANGLFFIMAEQAVGIYRVPESGVRTGDVVLDVGASYGEFTRQALKDGAAKVVAIDPSPLAVTCLRRNLASEIASGKVILVEKGVWDQEGTLGMDVPAGASPRGKVREETDVVSGRKRTQVPLTSIDNIVRETGLTRVDFIKMDIEGAEPRALTGAQNTIARFRPRMAVCVYHELHHPILIANVVQSMVRNYRQRTRCFHRWDGQVFPDVAFFW